MSSIDWSNAPEGANGYVADDKEGLAPAIWYRRNGEALHWTLVGQPVKRQKSTGIRDNIIWRDDKVTVWNGEGLPPVGAVCEWFHRCQWERAEILAYHGRYAWVQLKETPATIDTTIAEIRPLRTPEQIAAEEREKAVHAMVRIMGEAARRLENQNVFKSDLASAYAQALLDAGYSNTEGGAA